MFDCRKHLTLFIALLGLCSISNVIAETNTEVKGFIALDALKVIKKRDRDVSFQTGIGVLDIKFYAEHDNLSAKIKLDLDGDISETYNIFEEATIAYRTSSLLRITFGKGLVPFHQKHFGVLESAYLDGGSVVGSNNSWRDQDRKLLAILEIGKKSLGFVNSITFFGDSQQIQKDNNNQPILDNSGSRPVIKSKRAQTFNSDSERGFANKFEIFIDDFTLYTSAIHYHNDVYPDDSYAFDLGGRYITASTEIWIEVMHGFYSTHQYAKYSARRQYENFFQLGMEYVLTQKFSILTNAECILVNNNTWDWIKNRNNNYKAEAGLKYKIKPNAYMTFGGLGERKHTWVENNKVRKDNAIEVASKFSLWF